MAAYCRRKRRSAIGTEVTSSASINNLALQIGLIAACIFIGWGLKEVLGTYVHPIFLEIDELVNGIIGALILWPLMKATKTDGYVDKKTISSFSGLCMEYLIVAAVGNLRIETVTTFAVPIAIYCVLMTVLIMVITVGLSYCFHKDDWFEKMITNFGQCTGSTPTGLALLRCVDPNNLTSAGRRDWRFRRPVHAGLCDDDRSRPGHSYGQQWNPLVDRNRFSDCRRRRGSGITVLPQK